MSDQYYDRAARQAVFVSTRAQVLGGYVGQIVLNDEVIWQSDVVDAEDAIPLASDCLSYKMKELFA